METLPDNDLVVRSKEIRNQQTDHSTTPGVASSRGDDGPTSTVRAIALISLVLSLLAIVIPVEQFAVAIPAVILAIATGYHGERIYTTMTAGVTALNLAMLSPHDDFIMAERPIQIYWTAMMWSAAPIVAMIVGYLSRLWRNSGQ
jgi:hypothetical protein